MSAETKPRKQTFHTGTALAVGLKELFKQLEERLSLRSPLNVYLAGGMAVHLYTGSRVTTDVDAEFGSRVFIPNDLIVDVTLENGTRVSIYFDTNYNASFALLHGADGQMSLGEAITQDQVVSPPPPTERPVAAHTRRATSNHILSPLDLAVSKIARFAGNDKEDIVELVRLGLTSADEIEQRATSALGGYVGGLAMVRLNLRDAVTLARQIESERDQSVDSGMES